jgi:hypothetical protein
MKKVMLFGALIALFASSNLYAETCTDTTPDAYNDSCEAIMRLDIPIFATITFPSGAGSGADDLFVNWDGTSTSLTDSINICIGTNGNTDIDIDTTSVNSFEVVSGAETVPYSLILKASSDLDLTDGTTQALANADADNLACIAKTIPLELAFTQANLLAANATAGSFRDTVTITVAPQ